MTNLADERKSEVRAYIVGFGSALLLSAASFGLVWWRPLSPATTLALVFGLALIQMIVHFRFFLHISFSRSSSDDLQLILFAALIMALMVSGTLVILFNLRTRMM